MKGRKVDVVVIGAGIAGLTAAWRLSSAGRSVQIIEANSRVGGRIHGFQRGDRAVQLGGRWTGPGQLRVKALAEELGIKVVSNPTFGDFAFERLGENADRVIAAVRQIDQLAEAVPLDAPWKVQDASVLDSVTLKTWLDARFDRKAAVVLGAVLSGFLPEPGDLSALHALFYIRSNGGLAGILGIDGPAHDSEMFEGGAHLLTDRLATRLAGHIVCDTPVLEIDRNEEGVEVRWQGGALQGEHAVVTLPPTLSSRIIYRPSLPPERDYLLQRMPIRGKIALALLYTEPFWRKNGKRLVETERLLLWDEGGEQEPAAYCGLVSIAWSRALWELREDACRAEILREIARELGPRAEQPLEFHTVNWAAEPWSRGCNSYLATGAWTAYGEALRKPVGRVHWAGAELSSRFVGQMDGAVRSAELAVDTILNSSKSR